MKIRRCRRGKMIRFAAMGCIYNMSAYAYSELAFAYSFANTGLHLAMKIVLPLCVYYFPVVISCWNMMGEIDTYLGAASLSEKCLLPLRAQISFCPPIPTNASATSETASNATFDAGDAATLDYGVKSLFNSNRERINKRVLSQFEKQAKEQIKVMRQVIAYGRRESTTKYERAVEACFSWWEKEKRLQDALAKGDETSSSSLL
ncbi:hypothetical protein Tco_0853027 [Tanacetum coccineum]